MKKIFVVTLYLISYLPLSAQMYNRPAQAVNANKNSFDQLLSSLTSLKNSSKNNEVEIKQLQERIYNLENSNDTIQTNFEAAATEINKSYENFCNSLNKKHSTLQERVKECEEQLLKVSAGLKPVLEDIRACAAKIDENSSAISDLKAKLNTNDKKINILGSQIENIESALKTLLEAVQLSSEDQPILSYTVKAGDNLEKIAKTYKVSVRSIKSYNNMVSDKIWVGQKLKIPK